MHFTIQSVINEASNVTQKISKKFLLNIELLIYTSGRKNCASMARWNGLPYRKVYFTSQEATDHIVYMRKMLVAIINQHATADNKGILLVDFTCVAKPFSQQIPGVTYDYDSCRKRVEKGLSLGFIVWSNGKICIPFDFTLWVRKKDAGDSYKTKIDLAKAQISAAVKEIPFKEVMLDGAFASQEMIQFFFEQNIHFTMRIPCNRVVVTNTNASQLRHCSELALKRNERYKTTQGWYKNFCCYFTTEKRKTKNGNHEQVYLVSNVKRKPKEHVMAYKKRWPQEKFHRTGKQHLGLGDCQSTNRNKQYAHIFSVMYSYALLERMKIAKKKKSVEEILHGLRCQKLPHSVPEYYDWRATFMA